ncbi:hypothetical protein [uncultured Flavobacterium sp.]|uniref:DoxX family protein n=1 Tax=uncultured Flavobacterium sp. TaxID=165435 RepID=UPI003081EA61
MKDFSLNSKSLSEMENIETTNTQKFVRILLGIFMITAAMGHFTFQRNDFQAQVPNWVPVDKDLVVILSGIVELVLGLTLIFLTRYKVKVGIFLAIFYVLVFPGNIAQYLNGTSALGLDTDLSRLIRLFFQPVLIFLTLWSTGAITYFKSSKV